MELFRISVSRACGIMYCVSIFEEAEKEIISFTRPDEREIYQYITYHCVGEVVASNLATNIVVI